MIEESDSMRADASPGPILIVGGYGSVGRRIAEFLLAANREQEVVLAGRSIDRARAAAAVLGTRCLPRRLDVADARATREAFEAASAVVMTTEAHLQRTARIAIDAGIPLVSIAASLEKLRSLAELDEEARAKRGLIVNDVGLAPGLMNAMAHDLLAKIDPPRRLELILRLSAFGDHGREAVRWTLERAGEAGGLQSLSIPTPHGGNQGILVDFVDREDFPSCEHVTSYLQLTPIFAMRALPASAGYLRHLVPGFSMASNATSNLLNLLGLQTDKVMVCVQAKTKEGLGRSVMKGTGQARITARVTGETLLRILEGGVYEGVCKMESILSFPRMRRTLENEGCTFFDML